MAVEVTPEIEAELQKAVKKARTIREAEIAQQAAGGKRWWASFELLSGGYDLQCPNWESGYGRGPTVVFATIAESEDALMEYIEANSLEEGSSIEWRFVEERADDYSPYSDRFPGPSIWHVWPDVPLQPIEDLLWTVRDNELKYLIAHAEEDEELKAMSLTKLIGRSLMESGEVYEESLDAIVEILEANLRRGQKLAEGI